ncbi:hypothetical protein [Nocardioides deserti]|uniref:hypothetical protein n=1 Tax=Nocardioides deserti TaxID=1588644 RepID=UPI001643589D|nr:hypothetical protein [Nocardioides deserti]GGO67979.1 hypothetical protein GCM10012276_00720 [Nocardioides deserti]
MTQTTTASRRLGTTVSAAWILPVIAVFVGGGIGDSHRMVGHTALLVLGLGAVAGVLWQLLNRRDLTNRLTFLACCVVVGAAFLALAPSGYLLANSGPGHVLAGTLAGLVLTEQWLRRRKQ